MANNFLNIVLCSRDWSKIENDDEFPDLGPLKGLDLLNAVCPIPDELRMIVDSRPFKFILRNKETGEIHPNGFSAWPQDAEGYEEEAAPNDLLLSSQKKHGTTSWYEWCVNHWGTKWGTYGTEFYELGGDSQPVLIEFQTAWNQPKPERLADIEKYLNERFFLYNFKWIGNDPSNDENVDLVILKERME